MSKYETTEQLDFALSQATGTERYVRHILNKNFYMTDGVCQLRELAQCYWLFDKVATELYGVWRNEVGEDPDRIFADVYPVKLLRQKGIDAMSIELCDGNNTVIERWVIDYTDFPYGKYEFWLQGGSIFGMDLLKYDLSRPPLVALLKSEY